MPVDLELSPLGSPLDSFLTPNQLRGLASCPYCGVSSPIMQSVWQTQQLAARGDQGKKSEWGAHQCTSCAGVVVVMGVAGKTRNVGSVPIARMFPAGRKASDKLPAIAATFLQQAFSTLHAPDAAAVMAGSAVDAMLKNLGLNDGSLYVRIDQAREKGLLTKGMADWAHSVRLGSNRPRHADVDNPHVSSEDAQRSVNFAEALGNFLFVLTAQIEEAAKAAGGGK